jgi:aspartate aminotransferase
MSAVLDPGDEVIISSPCWTYEGIALINGAKPIFIETTQEDEFRLSVKKLHEKLTSNTRLLVLNYPNNPTGATMNKKDLRALADLAVDHEFWVLSDEIYEKLVYDGFEHVSIASFGPEIQISNTTKPKIRIENVKASLGISFNNARTATISGIIVNDGDRKLEAWNFT